MSPQAVAAGFTYSKSTRLAYCLYTTQFIGLSSVVGHKKIATGVTLQWISYERHAQTMRFTTY